MRDPFKFRNIAFAGREFEGPYTKQSVAAIAQGVIGEALDVGCGKGAVLEALGLCGVGIDVNPIALDEARDRNPSSTFYARDAKEALAELRLRPDLLLCLGASQAIGRPGEALEFFSEMLSPGGHLLFGDGFWERHPAPEYLKLLDSDVGDMKPFDEFRDSGIAYGLQPQRSHVSSQEDWDDFEDHYFQSMMRWCKENPGDPDEPAFRNRMTTWRHGYESWGRGTLGFAMILYQKER